MGGFEQRPWTPTKRRGQAAVAIRSPGNKIIDISILELPHNPLIPTLFLSRSRLRRLAQALRLVTIETLLKDLMTRSILCGC